MSTNSQLKGDSLKRQLTLSKDYATNNNLDLVETIDGITLHDIGVSGFKGANSTSGTFAKFLNALASNKIEPNSVLLVESLDRISRASATDAMAQFLNILNQGIEIVTLTDNQRYTKESADSGMTSMFLSLGIMYRANEESAIKSKRLRSAWTNKRSNAHLTPLSKIAPAWIEYSEIEKKFLPISDRVKVVNKIFDMCANTCGQWAITKYLNQNNVPTFGKAKLWHKSYVNKILRNRAVLGEYQPCTSHSGLKVAEGEPIQNYYPQVVTSELFNLANGALFRRTNESSGRKGKTFSNIFAGLAYCGDCQSKMILRNRGSTSKGGKYLICSRKNVGGQCDMREWKLKKVEEVLFNHLKEVNFGELIGETSDTSALQNEKLALENEILNNEQQIDRIITLSINEALVPTIQQRYTEKLNELSQQESALKDKLNAITKKLDLLAHQNKAFTSDELKGLIDLVESNKDDYYFRSSINQLLGKTIQRIVMIEENNSLLPHEIDDIELVDYVAKNQTRIKVEYTTGKIRQIFVENDTSLTTAKTHSNTKIT